MFSAKLLAISAFLLSLCIAGSCKNGTGTNQQAGVSDSLPPVETKNPTADYKPAFPGQTRVPGMKTKTQLSIQVINSSLDHPWGICNLPDGRLLISQKMGNMCI